MPYVVGRQKISYIFQMIDPKDKHTANNDIKAPKLWGWTTYLSIAVAIVILGVAATFVDLKEIWRQIAACDKGFVLLGALAHYATYIIRGMRWRHCLIHLPIKSGSGKFGLLVFFYNFVDNLVPAKLGDVYAAHLARINFKIQFICNLSFNRMSNLNFIKIFPITRF